MSDVRDHLPAVRRILQALPEGNRAEMARLWSSLRNLLVQQEDTIAELQERVGPSGPPSRPPSSMSVVGLRAVIDQALSESTADSEPTSVLLQAITSLPPN
jgi:hypothetical protein